MYSNAHGVFLEHFYNNDVVCVFIVACNVNRVHFLPHTEHTVFLLQRSKGLILFREIIGNCEVCHPRCAFKLYGEVNSVKKHNYKLWLYDAVY